MGLRAARLRSFSVGAMKSPKRTGESTTAVPTSTRRRPGTFGIVHVMLPPSVASWQKDGFGSTDVTARLVVAHVSVSTGFVSVFWS